MRHAERLLFTDLDGTLCFHAGHHGIEELARHDDRRVTVRDPATGAQHPALDVSTPLYRIYLGARTRELLHRLRARWSVVIVSGARLATLRGRLPMLDFHDGLILENGAEIYDAALEPDAAWAARLAPQLALLPPLRERLIARGLALDVAGRTAMIRIRHADNPRLDPAAFAALESALDLPPGLQTTRNLGHLDLFPADAGKANAVRHVARVRGVPLERTAGIGDDVNDLGFLAAVGRAFVPGNAVPEVLAAARRRNWTVATGVHFNGIDELLDRLLAEEDPRL